MFPILIFLVNIIIAYLIGSISSAIIISRLFKLPDPRTQGSKNPGATNVLRLSGMKYGVMVLIADMLKGLLPLLFAHLLTSSPVTLAFTCLAAVLGHIFPVFFNFKGGKGMATALGAFLGFHFMMGVVIIGTWLFIANFSRYSSLASILAITFAPFYSLFAVGNLDAFLPFAIITISVVFQHRENITRLINGDEPKLNFRRQPPESPK